MLPKKGFSKTPDEGRAGVTGFRGFSGFFWNLKTNKNPPTTWGEWGAPFSKFQPEGALSPAWGFPRGVSGGTPGVRAPQKGPFFVDAGPGGKY